MERKENSVYPMNRKPYRGPKIHSARECSAPTLSPSAQDIAWAAGLYEGEGSICKAKKCHFGQGLKITITQKDSWTIERMRELFGGTLNFQNERNNQFLKAPVSFAKWTLSGVRAFGFSMTIYKFLSPRRQEQFRNAWGERMAA